MKQAFVLPGPVGRLVSLLPAYPGSLLFATGLNMALNRHLPMDLCEALKGKALRISIADAGANFDFEWANGRFAARAPAAQTDLTISANAHDFMLLARRRADPDTLFFSRRLMMEGDTELGLRVKNALDALDINELDLGRLLPLRLLDFMKKLGFPSSRE
jgi:O2-independent ubiquinone biosynthesis accessory factor UbiT